MVEHGATNLIMLSRRAEKVKESQTRSNELDQMGCSVQFVAGSVENPDDVRRAIASTGRAIKGVFQLAMVLKVTLLLSPNDLI